MIQSHSTGPPPARRSAPDWLLKRCRRLRQGPIIGRCAIGLRSGFAKQSRVILIVAGTVSGQMVRIGLIGGKISLVSRFESQAKEIKQLAVKKVGRSGIGQCSKQHIAPSGMIGLPAI